MCGVGFVTIAWDCHYSVQCTPNQRINVYANSLNLCSLNTLGTLCEDETDDKFSYRFGKPLHKQSLLFRFLTSDTAIRRACHF